MINLIYSDQDVLVVYKESGLPTVPLSATDEKDSLLKQVGQEYPEVLAICSRHNYEGGVLHRLDTPTKGLVLIARSQKAFERLMVEQYNDRITKTYEARVHKAEVQAPGFEPFTFGSLLDQDLTINSYFRPYGPKGALVRPVLYNQDYLKKVGKLTVYTTLTYPENDNCINCSLTRGFRHQIRSHLAWAGFPIDGDESYNGIPSESFGLTAVSISFKSPSTGKTLNITA